MTLLAAVLNLTVGNYVLTLPDSIHGYILINGPHGVTNLRLSDIRDISIGHIPSFNGTYTLKLNAGGSKTYEYMADSREEAHYCAREIGAWQNRLLNESAATECSHMYKITTVGNFTIHLPMQRKGILLIDSGNSVTALRYSDITGVTVCPELSVIDNTYIGYSGDLTPIADRSRWQYYLVFTGVQGETKIFIPEGETEARAILTIEKLHRLALYSIIDPELDSDESQPTQEA